MTENIKLLAQLLNSLSSLEIRRAVNSHAEKHNRKQEFNRVGMLAEKNWPYVLGKIMR